MNCDSRGGAGGRRFLEELQEVDPQISDQSDLHRRFPRWDGKKSRARLLIELQIWEDLAYSSLKSSPTAPSSHHLLQIAHNNITGP